MTGVQTCALLISLASLAVAGLRRPLVMAPPHLCEETWPKEIAAVWGPDALALQVRGPADLYALEALRGDPRRVVAIVSREAAKLGSGAAGVPGACRRCGSASAVPDEKRAARRAACKAEVADIAEISAGQRAALDFARAVAHLVDGGAEPALAALLGGTAPRLLADRARIRAAYDAAHKAATAEQLRRADARARAATPAARRAAWAMAVAAGGAAFEAPALARRAGRRRRYENASAKAVDGMLRAAASALVAADAPGAWYLEVARAWLAVAEDIPEDERTHDCPFAELCRWSAWALGRAHDAGLAAEVEEVRRPLLAAMPAHLHRRETYAYDRVKHAAGYLLDLSHAPSVAVAAGDWGKTLEVALEGFGAPSRRVCGEALWTAVPEPRRVPLARLIAERVDALGLDSVVIDEAHEYNAANSAQGAAARILRGLGRPVLYLTGSTNNGYAEHLFEPLQSLSADFRADFGPRDHARFQDRYGYVRRSVDLTGQGASAAGAGGGPHVQAFSGANGATQD